MKTKTLIALVIAIVVTSACKKEEITIPENHIRVVLDGEPASAIVYKGYSPYRINGVNNVIEFSLPIGQNFFYKNRFGNSTLTIYINDVKQEPVIQLVAGDRTKYEYVVEGSGE